MILSALNFQVQEKGCRLPAGKGDILSSGLREAPQEDLFPIQQYPSHLTGVDSNGVIRAGRNVLPDHEDRVVSNDLRQIYYWQQWLELEPAGFKRLIGLMQVNGGEIDHEGREVTDGIAVI